ncbi:MAG: hypothetical protein LKK39_00190 [Oscillospiraceae bacterium]|nr:hypothetical protein [Oscillospiraceae bacterium]
MGDRHPSNRWHRRRRAARPGHKTACGGLFRNETNSANATSVQPQTQAMGAARRDPGRGEIPMAFA